MHRTSNLCSGCGPLLPPPNTVRSAGGPLFGTATVGIAVVRKIRSLQTTGLENPRPGKKLFFMAPFDKEIRRTFAAYLKYSLRNPLRLFSSIYSQSIHLQQPIEILDGMINLCDDCVNMMVYEGRLINSCRLDEYRMYGGPINVIKQPVS